MAEQTCPIDPDRMYSVKEVAAIFRVTPVSVARWISSGALKAYRMATVVRIYGQDLIEATQMRMSKPSPQRQPAPRTPPKAKPRS